MLFFCFITVGIFIMAFADDVPFGGITGSRILHRNNVPSTSSHTEPTCYCQGYWGGVIGSRNIQEHSVSQISSSSSPRTSTHSAATPVPTIQQCSCKEFWGGVVASANITHTPPAPLVIPTKIPGIPTVGTAGAAQPATTSRSAPLVIPTKRPGIPTVGTVGNAGTAGTAGTAKPTTTSSPSEPCETNEALPSTVHVTKTIQILETYGPPGEK